MGKEFAKYYNYNKENLVITLWRNQMKEYCENTQHLIVDLLDTQQIEDKLLPILEKSKNEMIENVYIIHGAGKAKNELLGVTPIIDKDNDGIDDEMYNAQIKTFDNIHSYINNFFKQDANYNKIKFTIVGMWSLIDRFNSPIHQSMRAVNNITRERLKKIAKKNSNYHTIMLSLSTVATETEKQYRKYADQTYWLSGSEVVDKSIETISHRENIYEDIAIYKYHPLYETYFKNETNEQRIERFKKEIGII